VAPRGADVAATSATLTVSVDRCLDLISAVDRGLDGSGDSSGRRSPERRSPRWRAVEARRSWAVQGLRRTTGRSEDMGGCGSTSRTRCRGPRPPTQAGGGCARGGAIRRWWLASVSARGAKRRGRRRTRGTTEFLARWRSSGRCSCRRRCRGGGDRRWRGPSLDGGGGSGSRLGLAWRRGFARVPGGAEPSAGPL
jgi:hypothetical protein